MLHSPLSSCYCSATSSFQSLPLEFHVFLQISVILCSVFVSDDRSKIHDNVYTESENPNKLLLVELEVMWQREVIHMWRMELSCMVCVPLEKIAMELPKNIECRIRLYWPHAGALDFRDGPLIKTGLFALLQYLALFTPEQCWMSFHRVTMWK